MSFGLDIGTHSAKVVELAREGKKLRLVASGVVASPPGAIESNSERDLAKVSEVVKKLVSDTKISKKQVVFALPEQLVYTRVIAFPPLSEEEVNSAIEWQVEGYIPIPKKDAVLDWEIIARNDKNVQVLLVATPKTLVGKYMKVVEDAGLTPLAVETELIALTRAIAPVDRTALIIDFGATSTDLAVAVNRQLMFARSIPTAGTALTRAVATGIGVDTAQAEEYKKTYGLTKALEGKVKGALSGVVTSLLDELKKALGFWQQEHPDLPVQVGFLTGGTAGLPEIIPSVTGALGIEISVGNPFAYVAVDPKLAKSIAPYSPLYAIAAGLAMRELVN